MCNSEGGGYHHKRVNDQIKPSVFMLHIKIYRLMCAHTVVQHFKWQIYRQNTFEYIVDIEQNAQYMYIYKVVLYVTKPLC